MRQSIHGHEVMHFMMEHGGSFTKQSLREAIVARFGADARFHTCSADGMNAEQLIDFLEARGKFIAEGTGLTANADKICKHH